MAPSAAAAALGGVAAGLGVLAADSAFGFSKDIFQMWTANKAVDYVMSEMAAGRYSQIDRFLATVAQKPDHPFIIFQEAPGNGQNVVISYREADEQSTRLARYLVDECGAKPGDMIASLNENHPGFIIVMLACWKLGGAVGYLNFSQTGRVFQHSVSVSQAKIVVFEPRLYSRIEENKDWFAERGNQLVCYSDFPESGPELPFPHKFVTVPDLKAKYPDIKKAEIPKEMRKDVLPSSVASLVYTSGTTGLPKAAILNHAKHCSYISMFTTGLAQKGDRIYGVGPFYHANGGFAIHVAYMTGATVCFTRKFSASQFFAFCTQTGVTMFPYVGEFIRFLTLAPPSKYDRAHKVRTCFGNGVRPDIWTAFEKRYGIKIVEGFGSTEGNVGCLNFWGKPGAVGFQGPLFRLMNRKTYQRLVKIDLDTEQIIRDPKTGFMIECAKGEPGEIIGRMINDNFVGYFGNSEATTKKFIYDCFEKGDHWVRSGDLLMLGKDNFYYFVDRLGDTYRWKGENVSTMEVRDVMLECRVLQDCNAYGVTVPSQPDGRAGMVAVIVRPEFKSKMDEAMLELGKHAQKELPPYAVPRFVRVFETFESTSTVTFKYTKTAVQKDGFNPATITEPLYFYVEAKGGYVPLTQQVYNEIVGGKAKL